jgi:membrane protein DedA with SNARE-associated domain
MQPLVASVARFGLPFIFANVFLEQLGLPIPALPTLVVAGALSVERELSAPEVLLVALAATLAADSVWYGLGRRHGFRVLKILCKTSLSPDSCVRQTTSILEKWGMPSLLVAKFVPGFSTVAPPLAGAIGTRLPVFLLFDAGGTLLWTGVGIGAGIVFHRAIDRVLEFLTSIGGDALALVGAALAVFVAVKFWQRRRFYRMLRMARITPEELHELMDKGRDPLVLDVRLGAARLADPRRIPGARTLAFSEIEQRLVELPRDREIVLYCT